MKRIAAANEIRGRVLITGASSGIGARLAADYLADGWQVFGCGRNLERLVAMEGITPLVFDATDREQVQSAGRSLEASLAGNKLDLLILNAGGCEYIDDPLHFDDLLFERIVQTNLVSVGYCLSALLPQLSRRGRLALMSSSATYMPLPRAEAYGASKAAVNYLAQTLAASLQGNRDTRDIGVSLICPGFVRTPLTDKNDFPMPMCIDVEQASAAIRKGLQLGVEEIHFPKRFTLFLKTLSLLPRRLLRSMIVAATRGQSPSNTPGDNSSHGLPSGAPQQASDSPEQANNDPHQTGADTQPKSPRAN